MATVAELQAAVQQALTARDSGTAAPTATQNAINNQPQAQLLTAVDQYSGRDTEVFEQFLAALSSNLTLAGIPDSQRHNYLRLRLKGSALLVYNRLDPAVRDDYNQAITALRAQYKNANNRQLRGIKFDARNYQEGKETPREYLDALRTLAEKAFADTERVARVRDRFVKGMTTNKLKKKLLNAPVTDAVDQLVDRLGKADKACPPDDRVNAVSELNADPDD